MRFLNFLRRLRVRPPGWTAGTLRLISQYYGGASFRIRPFFSQNYNLIDPTFFTTLQHMWKKLPNDEDGTISQKAYDPLTFQWEDIYLGHVRGERPEGSRPWWEIDNLLMPVNVDGYHWVLAAVNLVERKVRIYDSLCIRLFGSNMSPH
ncbi:hypothetical protein ACOSQ3_024773 [Xanthoceras sorbifolium]